MNFAGGIHNDLRLEELETIHAEMRVKGTKTTFRIESFLNPKTSQCQARLRQQDGTIKLMTMDQFYELVPPWKEIIYRPKDILGIRAGIATGIATGKNIGETRILSVNLIIDTLKEKKWEGEMEVDVDGKAHPLTWNLSSDSPLWHGAGIVLKRGFFIPLQIDLSLPGYRPPARPKPQKVSWIKGQNAHRQYCINCGEKTEKLFNDHYCPTCE